MSLMELFSIGNTGNPEKTITETQNNEWQELPEIDHNGLVVTCYTPNGKAIEVQATSPEHAAWLKKMNPQPTAQ